MPPGAALVEVDDVLLRLQDLARAARAARSELRVVGVTGSTGKTSTKDLLAAVLASLGCYASPASYNNEFGLPITLLNAPADRRVVVAEMGERFPGDIAALCGIAKPTSESSRTSAWRTQSTSGVPRARPGRWGSCSTHCRRAASRC